MTATISSIDLNGSADKLGLQKGDIIKSINGNPVNDVIDYMFWFTLKFLSQFRILGCDVGVSW